MYIYFRQSEKHFCEQTSDSWGGGDMSHAVCDFPYTCLNEHN